MLHVIEDGQALNQATKWHTAYPYLLQIQMGWFNEDHRALYLSEQPEVGKLMLAGRGNGMILISDPEHDDPAAVDQLYTDLFQRRITPDRAWPDDGCRESWGKEKDNNKGEWLELVGAGTQWLTVAKRAGFVELPPENEVEEHGLEGAYFYWLTGKPRFADRIKHPCRVAEGFELLDLMQQATEYDTSGEYTKEALLSGPSFVLEVDGVPRCWSCTHPNRAMGMIYTPDEFRRQGYATSLAAFQIDYMLRTDGAALCYVMASNKASQNMMDSFRAERLPEPYAWRSVRWL